jgi:hypothetical protein
LSDETVYTFSEGVEEAEKDPEQRFILAHKLGAVRLGHENVFAPEHSDGLPHVFDPHACEECRYAMALLVPAKDVLRLAAEGLDGRALVDRFLAPEAVVWHALVNVLHDLNDAPGVMQTEHQLRPECSACRRAVELWQLDWEAES